MPPCCCRCARTPREGRRGLSRLPPPWCTSLMVPRWWCDWARPGPELNRRTYSFLRAEVGGRELLFEVCGLTNAHDLAVQHDRRVVRDIEHRSGELLDHEDRHTGLRHLPDDVVELLDDQRGQPHRQLVEQQQRRLHRESSRQREHLLLASGHRPRDLTAALPESRES